MARFAEKRIRREILDIIQNEETTPCGIKVELINDSMFELRGEITGPPDTPYEGGKFKLEIKLPRSYPFDPPRVQFLTKVWHVNICSAWGVICLDILRHKWSASLTLRTVLLSLQVLLSTPEPTDPLDVVVARQFQQNQELFMLTARHWTNVYAGGPSKNQGFDDKVRKIMESGMCENDSLELLSSCDWDLEYAFKELHTAFCCEVDESEYDYMEEDQSEDDQSEEDASENDHNYDDNVCL